MLLLVIGPGDVSHEESLHEPGELFEWLLAWIKQDNVRPAKMSSIYFGHQMVQIKIFFFDKACRCSMDNNVVT